MAKRKALNPVKLKAYLEKLATEDYSMNAEDVDDFVDTIFDYAVEEELVSYRELHIYIDGLLTPLDIEQGLIG